MVSIQIFVCNYIYIYPSFLVSYELAGPHSYPQTRGVLVPQIKNKFFRATPSWAPLGGLALGVLWRSFAAGPLGVPRGFLGSFGGPFQAVVSVRVPGSQVSKKLKQKQIKK